MLFATVLMRSLLYCVQIFKILMQSFISNKAHKRENFKSVFHLSTLRITTTLFSTY